MSSEDAVAQQLRQGGSKRAPQADGDQNDHIADHVGRCALEDLDDGHTVDLVAGVQAHADRRSDQTDGQTGDHHGTELQRREAVLHHDRQQDGGEQQDGRADIDEGADHQDQHIKDQCNGPCGHVQGHEEGTHRLRHLLHGQHPCKDGGKADDEHDGGRRDQGLFQSLPDTLPCQLLVDEEAHQHGIQHGHTGTFGCSAHAEGNADDDEQRHDEGRNAGKQALGGALAVKLDLFRMPALLGADDVHQHQLSQTDQDAGHGTCHEQRTHRCTGDHGVNDHGGGGRDDHAHGGGCHRDTGRSFRRVAFLLHGGDQDGTQSRGIGHRGAGNTAKDHGSHDVHFAQTAADGAQQLHAEVDDALGDAAGVHQFASQHEQRHSDHQLTVGTVPHALRQHGNKGRCIDQNVGHTGSADGESQRDAQRGKEDQQHQKDEHCHSCVLACYSRGQPAGCPLAFTVTWPFFAFGRFCLCLCDDILHLLDLVGGADALGDTLVVHGLHSGLEGLQLIGRGLVDFAAGIHDGLLCGAGVLVDQLVVVLAHLGGALGNDIAVLLGQAVPPCCVHIEGVRMELVVDLGEVLLHFIELHALHVDPRVLLTVCNAGLQAHVQVGVRDGGWW